VAGGSLDSQPCPGSGGVSGTRSVRPVHSRTSLRLFDGFAVVIDGRRMILPTQIQRLLAYLAVAGCTSRSALAGALWPETLDRQSRAALRTSLWRMQKLVPGLLTVSNWSVQFSRDAAVDVTEFLDAAYRVLEIPEPEPQDVLAVPLGWRELLPGWDEEWVILERERLRQLRLHLLELRLDLLLARGDYSGALATGYAAIQTDPHRESTNRALIRARASGGRRGAAHSTMEPGLSSFAPTNGSNPGSARATG
jgi:DNA-binding SARP family transcriptional activator